MLNYSRHVFIIRSSAIHAINCIVCVSFELVLNSNYLQNVRMNLMYFPRSYVANERDGELRGYARERDRRREQRHGTASPLYASPPRSPSEPRSPSPLLAGTSLFTGISIRVGKAIK